VPRNGDLIQLAPGPAEVIARVPFGVLALDGDRLIPFFGDTVHERNRLMSNGSVMTTVIINQKGQLREAPLVTLTGLSEEKERTEIESICIGTIEGALLSVPMADLLNDNLLKEHLRVALRRVLQAHIGKKPVTHVHLFRI
jgi:ribonuclease J